MAKPAKSERQAKIDAIRSKQQNAERRRGLMIVGVCAVVALLIVGAAAFQPIKNWWDTRQFRALELSEIGAPASSCQETETKEATGNAEHVDTSQQVEYDEAPPAFGPHWNEFGVAPAPFSKKFYTTGDRPELESLVHNLEHGYTVLWYDETIAEDGEAMDAIRGIADKFEGTDNLRSKFIAVPWTAEDGDSFPDGQHVAFSHWSVGGDGDPNSGQQGVWQYCSDPSGEALEAFMEEYPYTDSPEPNAM
ncbi:DUF3105 domain-containing protein [Nocardioides coralli]|uniref:DUF3105 domain-containing protein n=1 Tax=Nocardioides coralli TaxID=2872154 RepID=UPI001CA3BC31|nr:DUF3105 domain-containing protein [Nocardioides coralli]QZY30014.1 DUF3105 domain-containing protein [Nocardioides coralli]